MALYEKGKCDIRAVAGEETADPKDPDSRDLMARAEWAAGRGEAPSLTDREEPASDAERLFATDVRAGPRDGRGAERALLPLRDEEGVLGVLVFESGIAGVRGREPARGGGDPRQPDRRGPAERPLCHQVPMVDALGALAARKQALLALPRRQVQAYAAVGRSF